MKHTKKYTWKFDKVKKGKVLFKHHTKECLDDVTDFLDDEDVDYEVLGGRTMLRVYYGNSVYQYFYTTGRWAKYNSGMNIPKKHYHSTGVKDFLTRFLRGKVMGYNTEGIGYQNTDTSFKAAQDGIENKLTLRQQVLNVLLESSSPLGSYEIADKLNKPFISIQPRVTELANDLLIKDSGKRGKTKFNKSCILWEACAK